MQGRPGLGEDGSYLGPYVHFHDHMVPVTPDLAPLLVKAWAMADLRLLTVKGYHKGQCDRS